MNDIPFYDPNKDGLFDRANRRNHTELFVIVQIPDHFTFIIDFEFLGAVGLYGILVMSLPVADVQAAILCSANSLNRRNSPTESIAKEGISP